jgi:hypothetical protein
MIRLCTLFLLASLSSASAQGVFDRLLGQYGSASDPSTSCASNPHELSFEAQPPHANFTWTEAWTDVDGRTVSHKRYDMLDYDDSSLTLRLEGDSSRTADGGRPIWILRLTTAPEGYCWGRADWPSVHCENQQVRCEKATS